MNMNLIKLSYDLQVNSPVHVDLNKPEIKHNNFISVEGYNSFIINVENHCGTHVDAPAHFLEEGKLISEYSPEELTFKNPLVLDIPKDGNELIEIQDIEELNLFNVDMLIFKTGFEKFRDVDVDKYLIKNPGVTPDAVKWIRENFPNIRCLGIDCVSMSGYKHPELGREAHVNAFIESNDLGVPLLLIEDLKLSEIKNRSIKKILVVPWQIKGIDSAPCSILAWVK